ncbi:MAG: hypothetical protein ACOCWQ_01980 [Nanoarchaeota archaeon]
MPPISDFSEGDQITGIFHILAVERLRFQEKQGSYLRLTLSDATGTITGLCFDPDLVPIRLHEGMTVHIKNAAITSYKDRLRLHFLPGSISKQDF